MSATPNPRALRTRRALAALRRAAASAGKDGGGKVYAYAGAPVHAMGLAFPGPLGLAAGFDRFALLAQTAPRLGLGAVEAGTFFGGSARELAVLGSDTARHGSNAAIRGVSIGKRPATPWSRAEDDFLDALFAFHRGADYLTLNPGRDHPRPERFALVLREVVRARDALGGRRHRRIPLVAKLPFAWTAGPEGVAIATAFVAAGADGLLLSAEGAACPRHARAILRRIATALGREACIVSVGGIDGAREARARMDAGAHLIQVHRGAAAGGARFTRALALELSLRRFGERP